MENSVIDLKKYATREKNASKSFDKERMTAVYQRR